MFHIVIATAILALTKPLTQCKLDSLPFVVLCHLHCIKQWLSSILVDLFPDILMLQFAVQGIKKSSVMIVHCFLSNMPFHMLQEHWFTIRRVYGDFWNFNSLFPAPQPLSQFYLSAFLATLREQGYTIFVVKGPLSQQQSEDAGQPDSHGAWFTPEQVSRDCAVPHFALYRCVLEQVRRSSCLHFVLYQCTPYHVTRD